MEVLERPAASVAGLADEELRARLSQILNRHPAVGLAVGVVRGGDLVFFHGHGLADVNTRTPVTPETVFRIGSITKTFTAIAVMQLWERGLVDLDAPAAEYLLAYELAPAGPGIRPPTVRQLLTHTGGVPEQARRLDIVRPDWGQTVASGRPVPSLAEYYGGRLRIAVQPGTTFQYGDHGYATLGQIVEDLSGLPLERYFRDHIFAPLGMSDSDLLRAERLESRLATGYKLGPRGLRAVTYRELITKPAGAIYSTTRDMARYVAALLGGGGNRHGSVLRSATLALMYEPQYQPDPRIPGMGLAFFRGDVGGHFTVEHQGILPGFNSQIWLAPDDGVGLVAFTNGAQQADRWLVLEMANVLGALVGAPPAGVRHDIPQRPETWSEVCGWYKPAIAPTDPRYRMFFGAGVEVLTRAGRLRFRMLSPIPEFLRGFELYPDSSDDPYVFALDLSKWGMGKGRLIFRVDASGKVDSCVLDFQPVILRKQPDDWNPRRVIARGAAAGAAAALLLQAGRVRRRKARAARTDVGG